MHYGLCENGELRKFRNTSRRNAEQGTQTGDFCDHSRRFINQPFGKNVARFFLETVSGEGWKLTNQRTAS